MFGSKKKTQSPEDEPVRTGSSSAPRPSAPRGSQPKGRPTPTRKEREAARRQPVVATDRQAAKKAERDRRREAQQQQNIAMQVDDERFLPAKDKGPQRRYIRRHVDARHNVGDWFLILLVVMFLLSLFLPVALKTWGTWAMMLVILVWAVDSWIMWRGLKKKLLAAFGSSQPGNAMYAVNRVMMFRRLRLPKPQVGYGDYPS